MENPFIHPNLLNPDVTTRVNKAYHENVVFGRIPGATLVEDVGLSALGSTIRSATANDQHSVYTVFAGLDQIRDPTVVMEFESSFAKTEQLFALISLTTPTPEQFTDAGINLEKLGQVYERMETEGLQPELVLSPSLSQSDWQVVYQCMSNDKLINSDNRLNDYGGLGIIEPVSAHWDVLTVTPDGVPTLILPSGGISVNATTQWSLRLIPRVSTPASDTIENSRNRTIHPTINEYLTLQAMRLQAHEPPIDTPPQACWLNGSFIGGDVVYAPIAGWTSRLGQISIMIVKSEEPAQASVTRRPEWQ